MTKKERSEKEWAKLAKKGKKLISLKLESEFKIKKCSITEKKTF